MFPQLPSTSHNSAPFTNLWENQQQLQNYYQQYYNTPMTVSWKLKNSDTLNFLKFEISILLAWS